MKIVIDTHSLFWYLIRDKRLSERAKLTIRRASTIYVPTIALLELLYLMRKLKLDEQFPKLFDKLKVTKKYTMTSLDTALVESLTMFCFQLEIHDNIIVSTAKNLNLPLVTLDTQIKGIYKNIIW